MTSAHRVLVLSGLLASVALAPATTASAQELLATTVSAADAAPRVCTSRLVDAGPSLAHRAASAPGDGWLTARLDAAEGDWDLAIFDRTGDELVAGSSSFGPSEVATGFTWAGDEVVVQACRRSGAARTATLSVDFDEVEAQPDVKLQLVEVSVPSRARMGDLQKLGLDLTEHGGDGFVAVVLHGDRDAEKLRRAGFITRVEEQDLVEQSVQQRAADRRFAATTSRAAIPSGRTSYRRLPDYTNDMKRLVEENPGLVRPITLPFRTYEGRTVEGIEITTDVDAADGKPVFLQMGVHHAREWPSGEHAMEWAFEIVNAFKAGDARAQRLMGSVRTIVVPLVNPDGFNVSREAGEALGGGDGREGPLEEPNLLVPLEYQRKNCRYAPPREAEGGDCEQTFGNGLEQTGVDPNRNYGGFWGGPGADQTNPLAQSYPGPGPFSEPETQNIRDLISKRHVTTLITNHTFSNLLLRPPAIAAQGETPDEPIYKALGDSMAEENGYASQFSYQLYDTTGGTEDWSYYSTGGLGYTFEIGPDHFHPEFADTVAEWEGTTASADPDGHDGGGNREAYWKAMENAADETKHAVIDGELPPGTTLRLKKSFQTATFPQSDGEPILFDDTLETTMQVPASGRFAWHINQSTRPVLRNDKGREATGDPSPPEEFAGSPAGPEDGSETDGAEPCADFDTTNEACVNDHAFVVPEGPGIDNAFATVRITWPDPVSDWDMKVFRDADLDGNPDEPENAVGTSGNGATNGMLGVEEITIGPDMPKGGYVARVINYAAASPYEGTVEFRGPLAPREGPTTEAWTLSCERDGQVLESQQLFIERGERKTPDLSRCARSATAGDAAQAQGGGASADPSSNSSAGSAQACTPTRGFRSTRVGSQGRRLSIGFDRAKPRRVTVDVFQQSVGRRVIGERLVARFRNRTSGFRWNGKATRPGRRVTDGYYFVRYRMPLGGGLADVRRTTVRRENGRFSVLPPFYKRNTCGIVRSYKLTRPVFGGRTNRAVYASYQLNRAAQVAIVVTRGGEVVRRLRGIARQAGRTFRVRLDSEKLGRGAYKVRLVVRRGSRTRTITLTTRRL